MTNDEGTPRIMTEHVQGFDSLEEMFAAMGAAEEVANADLLPGQVRLREDTGTTRYWAQPLPEQDEVVFGEVYTLARVQSEDPGFDPAENRSRGYLTGRFYSAFEPDGDPHDTHVSQVVPISAEVFAEARRLGWPTWSRLHEDPECLALAHSLALAEALARS